MSEAELHFIRARLLGGQLSKARRGELKMPLPVGLVYDPADKVVLDPDTGVQHAVKHLFATFARTGSARAVVHPVPFGLPSGRLIAHCRGVRLIGGTPNGRCGVYRVICAIPSGGGVGVRLRVRGRWQ
jgi:hypothetical protein